MTSRCMFGESNTFKVLRPQEPAKEALPWQTSSGPTRATRTTWSRRTSTRSCRSTSGTRCRRRCKDEARGVEIITVDGKTLRTADPQAEDARAALANAARPAEEDLDEDHGAGPGAGRLRPGDAPDGPRPGGHLGRGHLPVARARGRSTSDPRAGAGGLPDLQRLLHRVPAAARRATWWPRRSRCSTPTTAWPRSSGPSEMGFKLGFFPVRPPSSARRGRTPSGTRCGRPWRTTGMVLGFHIGTEPVDPTGRIGIYHRGRGGAVLNYIETTYGGQRAVEPADRLRRARPPPRPARAGVRGRRHVGAVPGRPHGRGLPPARCRRAPAAVEAAQRVPLHPGVRLVPARPLGRAWPTRPWAGRT